jgi:hypothetical protein
VDQLDAVQAAGFAEVSVERTVVPGEAAVVGVGRRHGDDHDPAEPRLPAQVVGHVRAVHPGHLDVQQGHLRLEVARRGEGRQPVVRDLDLMAQPPQ